MSDSTPKLGTTPSAEQIVQVWRSPASAKTLPAAVQRQLPANPAGHVSPVVALHRVGVRAHDVAPTGYTVDCYSSQCYSSQCYSSQCYSSDCYTGQNDCGYTTSCPKP